MATFSKPTDIVRWADVDPATDRSEPPSGKKDTGWVFQDIPPAAQQNWLTGVTGDWLAWIDERLADGATDDNFTLLDPSGTFSYGYRQQSDGISFLGDDDFKLFINGDQRRLQFASGFNIEHDQGDADLVISGASTALRLISGEVIADDDFRVGGTASDFLFVRESNNDARIEFEGSNDLITYDRSLSRIDFTISGSSRLRVEASGISVTGTVDATGALEGASLNVSAGTVTCGPILSSGNIISATGTLTMSLGDFSNRVQAQNVRAESTLDNEPSVAGEMAVNNVIHHAGVFQASGAAVTPAAGTSLWNYASGTTAATGVYNVVYDLAAPTNACSVIATVNENLLNAVAMVTASSTTGYTVEVLSLGAGSGLNYGVGVIAVGGGAS